ncbi:MAG: FtsW/RodA/SpoVE family cell cycle protein [Bacteroidales bacterium]|jgi:cell division protein FtsW|nr:FtsW/RodA/SpoVE family cell cycle protein [Bacteroidales bacterium]
MKNKKFIGKLKGDRIIWGIIVLLSIFSIFVVYSTGSKLGDPLHKESLWFFIRGHVFYLVLGFLIMYVMSNINYRWIGRLSKIGFLVGLLLVFLTFIFGENIGEAKRSLKIFGISFQTIQLAEVLFVIYFAQWIARLKGEINNIKRALIPMIIYIGITCILITSQKTSGGIIMGTTYFMMFFISQLKKRYFFALLGSIIIVGVLSFVIISKYNISVFRLDTAKERIESFMGKGELNKETIITEAAIARGGILPAPGGSVLMGSVGESFSDYIYAFLIEEYGILIGILIILLYLGLFYRIRKAAISIQSAFGAYLAIALGFFIVFQAFTHMLVCVGYFPATGETLPMISRGGMSILTMSFCISILLNISEEAKEDRRKLKEEQLKMDETRLRS